MFIIQCIILFVLSWPLWAAEDEEPAPADTTEATSQEASTEEGAAGTNETEPQAERQSLVYITPDKAKQRMAETLRHLKLFQREDEIIEMNGNNGPFAGLYLPENTGKPQGGVLILHDIAQHAHWPNTVSPIREYLPDYGWNTLSVFFEQYIQKPMPAIAPPASTTPSEDTAAVNDTQTAPESSENNADNTAENNAPENPEDAAENPTTEEDAPAGDALDAIANNIDEVPDFNPAITPELLSQPAIPAEDVFLENMVLRVEDSLNKLNELGQYNLVIIANGYSANWAAKVLEKRLDGSSVGYALILIDAKSSDYPKVALNESLAKLNIPMLDIVTDQSAEMAHSIKTRKGTMLRNQNTKYMQLYLPAIKPDLTQTHNIISRRIRGWLLTNAAGEEIAVKEKNNF
ncbi:DUF3530 family protein [Pseudomonas sp. HK3]